MRIICFILFSLLSVVTYGSGVKECQSIKGKWVNLAVCQPADFLIFNFSDQEVTTLNGDIHQFKLNKNSFNVSVNDSIINLDFKRILISDDTIKLFLSNDILIPLVKYKKFKLAGFANKKAIEDFFLHTLIESTDSVKSITWYFDFVSNEHMVMTAMDHKKNDTLGHAYSWIIYLVDSICVLGLGDMFCSRFFVTETMGPKIIAYSTLTSFSLANYRLIKIVYEKRPDMILQTNLKERLIGNWEVKECSDAIRQKIRTLRITSEQVFVNEDGYSPESSLWYLDRFERLIVTNFENELRSVNIIKLNKKLIVENNGMTYVLKKKL